MEQLIDSVTQRFTLDGPDNAPVITFAHALSLDMRSWDPQVAFFKDRYRVLRHDLRGHSHIDEGGGPFSIEDMAGDVVGLLDHLDIACTHFVGSSLGGMVGYALASDHPKRLDSVTFLATQGTLPTNRAEIQRKNIALMNASECGLELQVDAMLERLNREGYRAADPVGYAEQREMAICGTVDGYARCCAAIAAMSYDDKLDRIATPTLIVAGSVDKSTPPARMAMYGEQIVGERMEIVENAGHFPNVDEPDAFNAVLDDFLSGN